MPVDVTPYISAVVTAAIAIFGFYGTVSTRLARIETKMDDLAETVRKHNGVVERMAIAERDISTIWKRHDELREQVHDMRREQQ